MLYVHDAYRGRVDVVPDLCYTATEFVCVTGFPVLPRYSFFFFRNEFTDSYAVLPIPLSLRSVFMAYAWSFCLLCALFTIGPTIAFGWQLRPQPGKWPQLIAFLLAICGTPCLLLFLLNRASFASRSRREGLAGLDGLPLAVAAALRQEGTVGQPAVPPPPQPNSHKPQTGITPWTGNANFRPPE